MGIIQDERIFEFVLDVFHWGGSAAGKALKKTLSIDVEPRVDLPRLIPGTINLSYESDHDDMYDTFCGPVSEVFPRGYEAAVNSSNLFGKAEGLSGRGGRPVSDKDSGEDYVTRLLITLTIGCEYFEENEDTFYDGSFYEGVQLETWNQLIFDFADVPVFGAIRFLLDVQ